MRRSKMGPRRATSATAHRAPPFKEKIQATAALAAAKEAYPDADVPLSEAYAATNDQEYFASITVPFLGAVNDWFPFASEDLAAHDPLGLAVCRGVWKMTAEELAARAEILDRVRREEEEEEVYVEPPERNKN